MFYEYNECYIETQKYKTIFYSLEISNHQSHSFIIKEDFHANNMQENYQNDNKEIQFYIEIFNIGPIYDSFKKQCGYQYLVETPEK